MILAPLPVLAVDAAVHSRRWKGPVLMIVVCVLGLTPWTVRNFRAFGQLLPVRSNFWPEVYFGNVDFSVHPLGNSMLYQQEGEILFANDLRSRALHFARSNPGAFARLTGEHIVAFWMRPSQLRPAPLVLLLMTVGGIVQAWRRKKRWIGFTSVLLLYPFVYYVSYAFARYRYPVEPLMYTLAGYFVYELWTGDRKPREATSAMLIG